MSTASGEKVLTVRLHFATDGTTTIERVKTDLQNLATTNANVSSSARGAARDLSEQEQAINRVGEALQSAKTMVQAFIGVWAVRKIIDEMKELTFAGIDFNAQLEQSKLGLGALTNTFGILYDAQGRVLKGNDAYNASMALGADLQDKLKLRALSTTLQYSDLLDVLQRGMPQMMQHLRDANGFVVDNQKLVDFTATFAQGARTAGLGPEEIGVNLQRFLQGTADPRHARFAAMLLNTVGDTPEKAREQMKQWEEQGVLFDKLTEKLAAFKHAGEDSMNTYTGALSNLKDAWQQLLGQGTQGATTVITQSMIDLAHALVTIDGQGHATFNPDLVSGIRAVGDELAKVVKFAVDLAVAFPEIKAQFGGMYDAIHTNLAILARDMSATNNMGLLLGPIGQMAVGAMNASQDQFDPSFFIQQRLGFAAGAQQRAKIAGFIYDPKNPLPALPPGYLPKVKGAGGSADDNADPSGFASFQRSMEEFHFGANGTHGDVLAQELQRIDQQRKQAVEKLKESEKKFSDQNEDWKKDFADIDATFNNRRTDAIAKYADEFRKAMDGLHKQVAKDPNDDYETKAVAKKYDYLASLDEIKRKFPQMGVDGNSEQLNAQKLYNDAVVQGADESLKTINERTLKQVKEMLGMREQMEVESQRYVEDQRNSLIVDAIDRELAQRKTANEQWAGEQAKQIELSFGKDTALTKASLTVLYDWLAQKNKQAENEANTARQRQKAGTDEWIADLRQKINEQMPPLGVVIENALLGSIQNVTSGIDEMFAHLANGQHDMGSVLDSVAHQLTQTWSKTFSSIITDLVTGKKSVLETLESFQKLKTTMDTGSMLDKALAGAGIGGMIGGLEGGPTTKASTGGTIGGMVGAIIGSYIPVIGTMIGSLIGAAIGGAIGSMMPTGKDSISVAIHNATLDALRGRGTTTIGSNESKTTFGDGSIDINEKGISPAARNDVLIQVNRQVKDAMKGYQSILDLFGDEFLKTLGTWKPTLNLTGGADGKDITDEGALTSLNDFLQNKLPKAAFNSYADGLRKALSFEGVGATKIDELMTYWGTLQGKELHDAVLNYATTLVSFVGNNKKMSGSMGDVMMDVAKKQDSATPLGALRDITSQIGLAVASLPKLVDIDDQIAAMGQLKDLSKSWYDSMVTYLQAIDQEEKTLHASIAQALEQVAMAGMTDQQKLDYDYQQMAQIREELLRTSDPQKIQELVSKLEGYAQNALGLAPDNAENRSKLTQILQDVDGLLSGGLAKARDEVHIEQVKAATMLQAAADALLAAGHALDPNKGTPVTDPNNPIVGDPTDPGGDTKHLYGLGTSADAAAAALDNLSKIANGFGQSSAADDLAYLQKRADEILQQFSNLQVTVPIEIPVVVDNGDLGQQIQTTIQRNIILTLKNNPDAANWRSN